MEQRADQRAGRRATVTCEKGRPEKAMRAANAPSGISVVLVTFNSSHCVEQCAASVLEQLRPDEIIVVDNASADESIAAARRAAPDAIVIESKTNVGFGRACNLGVAQARSATVLFINPDVVISTANHRDLELALMAPRLGLLVPLLSSGPGNVARHQVFRYRSWRRTVLPQAWSSVRPKELQAAPRPTSSLEDAWAAAALLFVRREEFLAVGGFDTRYFLYGEDFDLSRRYREYKFGVRLTDSVTGHHSGSASSTSSDSLRVAPLAWSLLGTLEYLSLWEGEPVAARAARAVLRSFRLQRWLLHGMRRVPGLRGRATRKYRQVERVEAFIYSHANALHVAASSSFCPDARVALRTAIDTSPGRRSWSRALPPAHTGGRASTCSGNVRGRTGK